MTKGKLWNLDLAMIMFIWPKGEIHYFKNTFVRSLGRMVVNPAEFWLAVEEIGKIKKYVGKFSRIPKNYFNKKVLYNEFSTWGP